MPKFGLFQGIPPGPTTPRYIPNPGIDQNNVPEGVLFAPGTTLGRDSVVGTSTSGPRPPTVGRLPQWTTYLQGMSGVAISQVQPSIYGGTSFVSDRFPTLSATDLATGDVGPFDILCQSIYTMNGTMPTTLNMPFSAIIQTSQTWNVNPQNQMMGVLYLGGQFQIPSGFTGNGGAVSAVIKIDDYVIKGPTATLNTASYAYVIEDHSNIYLNADQIILINHHGNVGGGGLTNKFQGYHMAVSTNAGSTFTQSMGVHVDIIPTGTSWTYGSVTGYDTYLGGHNVIGATQSGLPAAAGTYGLDIQGTGDYGTVGMHPITSLTTLPSSGNMTYAHYTGATSGHTFFLIVKNNAGTLSYTSLDLTANATTWVNGASVPT